MKGEGLQDITLEHHASCVHPCGHESLDEGHHIASEDPVTALEWELRGAGVCKAYAVAPLQEVNLPGLVSNSWLIERGSIWLVCNRTTTINEMSAALGKKCQQPLKLGACARRSGKA